MVDLYHKRFDISCGGGGGSTMDGHACMCVAVCVCVYEGRQRQ